MSVEFVATLNRVDTKLCKNENGQIIKTRVIKKPKKMHFFEQYELEDTFVIVTITLFTELNFLKRLIKQTPE